MTKFESQSINEFSKILDKFSNTVVAIIVNSRIKQNPLGHNQTILSNFFISELINDFNVKEFKKNYDSKKFNDYLQNISFEIDFNLINKGIENTLLERYSFKLSKMKESSKQILNSGYEKTENFVKQLSIFIRTIYSTTRLISNFQLLYKKYNDINIEYSVKFNASPKNLENSFKLMKLGMKSNFASIDLNINYLDQFSMKEIVTNLKNKKQVKFSLRDSVVVFPVNSGIKFQPEGKYQSNSEKNCGNQSNKNIQVIDILKEFTIIDKNEITKTFEKVSRNRFLSDDILSKNFSTSPTKDKNEMDDYFFNSSSSIEEYFPCEGNRFKNKIQVDKVLENSVDESVSSIDSFELFINDESREKEKIAIHNCLSINISHDVEKEINVNKMFCLINDIQKSYKQKNNGVKVNFNKLIINDR